MAWIALEFWVAATRTVWPGPAGSTAATLLAERGRRVVLLEQAHVADEVRAIGMKKWGAEFVSAWYGRAATFEFKDAANAQLPYAYQVRHSQFDEILFRRAGRPEFWNARFLVDASGRDTFLASHLGAKLRNSRGTSPASFPINCDNRARKASRRRS